MSKKDSTFTKNGKNWFMPLYESKIESVHNFYGNRVRLRSCGLHVKDNQLLLVRHDLGKGDFWSPPGGGVEVGETAVDCLRRELKEETGLIAEKCDFLFACEFIKQPLHAVELFFMISQVNGTLKTGLDLEPGAPEVILETRYLTWSAISSIPRTQLHGIFGLVDKPGEILDLRGYFTL
jgi:8-oxo-dGTP diphosphatase